MGSNGTPRVWRCSVTCVITPPPFAREPSITPICPRDPRQLPARRAAARGAWALDRRLGRAARCGDPGGGALGAGARYGESWVADYARLLVISPGGCYAGDGSGA